MIVTVDTNVLFSALHSRRGASHAILNLILNEKVRIALSPFLYFEYEAVLTRPDRLSVLDMRSDQVADVLDLLALLAYKHQIYFLLRPNLRDEGDNMVMECAFASQSDYLITSNVRDMTSGELSGFPFAVVTPREFYLQWRKHHG